MCSIHSNCIHSGYLIVSKMREWLTDQSDQRGVIAFMKDMAGIPNFKSWKPRIKMKEN